MRTRSRRRRAAPAYVPKDWQPIGLRVTVRIFGVAMPPGRTDSITDRNEEKSFTGQVAGEEPDARRVRPEPARAARVRPVRGPRPGEIERFLERPEADPGRQHRRRSELSAGSKGKEFRAKPDRDAKADPTLYRLWVVNEARFVMSVSGRADMKAEDADEFFKTATAAVGGRIRGAAVRQGSVLAQPEPED